MMSQRIRIAEDTKFDDDDDVTVRRGSLRRLRASLHTSQRTSQHISQHASHYWDSQRASTVESVPLLANPLHSPNSFPPPPSPTYRPQSQSYSQPHQLIAVCFNHMAGRHCEHCQQLNSHYGHWCGRHGRLEESPGSSHSHQPLQSRSTGDLGKHEAPVDGGEKGGKKEPPAPAGFWDKKLSKLRLQVLGLWVRTSQLF